MIKVIRWVFIIMIITISCSTPIKKEQNNEKKSELQDWKVEVEKTLKLFGHRNWIVVADGAYPQQSNPAIKTITINANQLEAVAFVNQLIEKAKHVDATIFVDKEMEFVPENIAKGIENYRTELHEILENNPAKKLLHEDIIRELDTSANLFNVLIIKTNLAIPYTSVFFQLECGYWNAEAEKNLRTNINKE